jgi:hypothetical protein
VANVFSGDQDGKTAALKEDNLGSVLYHPKLRTVICEVVGACNCGLRMSDFWCNFSEILLHPVSFRTAMLVFREPLRQNRLRSSTRAENIKKVLTKVKWRHLMSILGSGDCIGYGPHTLTMHDGCLGSAAETSLYHYIILL